jgi:hypothetical protein
MLDAVAAQQRRGETSLPPIGIAIGTPVLVEFCLIGTKGGIE